MGDGRRAALDRADECVRPYTDRGDAGMTKRFSTACCHSELARASEESVFLGCARCRRAALDRADECVRPYTDRGDADGMTRSFSAARCHSELARASEESAFLGCAGCRRAALDRADECVRPYTDHGGAGMTSRGG